MELSDVIWHLDNIESQLDKIYSEKESVCMINKLLESNKHIARWRNVCINTQVLKWWCYEVANWFSKENILPVFRQNVMDFTFNNMLRTTVNSINSEVKAGTGVYNINTYLNEYTDADIDSIMSSNMLIIHLCLLMKNTYNLQEHPDVIVKNISANIYPRCVHCTETIQFVVKETSQWDVAYTKFYS